MKQMKNYFSIMIIAAFVLLISPAVYANSAKQDFVDLSFTVNSKSYTSKSIRKNLDVAPSIDNGSTLVPFRAILEELGYEIQWDSQTSTISATRGNTVIKLQIDNKTAVVNGEQKQMAVPPKIVGGRTLVPLRFVSESSGANVEWDAAAKTVYITRTGNYTTGTALFYEKRNDGKKDVVIYNGDNVKVIPLGDKDIINWYSYKGKVLITMSDKGKNKNSFVMFKNDDFHVLIEDFDIKDTFEYNDNLVIHGYDRIKKINKLYRFDGEDLVLIADNFYVGKYLFYKDKLVINKYDNTRNYTLVAFDMKSWTPGVLRSGFVIKDTLQEWNKLYISGLWQEGTNRPLAAYDGQSTGSSSFKILNDNVPVDISKIAVCNDTAYAIVNNELVSVENNALKKISFASSVTGVYIKYTVNAIKSFNYKLYFSVTGAQFVDANGKAVSKPAQLSQPSPGIIEFTGASNYRVAIGDFNLSEFRIENNRLLMLGKDKTGPNQYNDPALFVYDGSNLVRALDVLKIENILSIKNSIFIDVQDMDRMTDKQRNTVLVYENGRIKNLVVGVDMKKWANVGGCMILAGYEDEMKRNKLFTYSKVFNEQMSSYDIKYWAQISGKLFVNGYDPDEKQYSLYRFINDTKVDLRDNIEVINFIKARGNYYFVYAYDRDPASPLKGKKILYIYNDATKEFVDMKVDIEIADMAFTQ